MWGRGEGQGQQMCLSREDVVLHVKRQVLRVSKQQEQVFEHLSEEKRVHPGGERRCKMRLTEWTLKPLMVRAKQSRTYK